MLRDCQTVLLLACVLPACMLLACLLSTPLPAQDPATYPPLPRPAAGTLSLPLDQAAPHAWVCVGPGTTIAADPTDGGMTVRYDRKRGEAFGAALPFRPGSLSGMNAIELHLQSADPLTVLVSLRLADGSVYSWPMLRIGDGEARTTLDIDDLRTDAFQNRGKVSPFDASRAAVLSVTDIAGFVGGKAEPVAFAIRGATLRFAGATPKAAPVATEPAGAGEAAFFAALVDGDEPDDLAALLPGLLIESLQNPDASRPLLLLGLTHLWRASEGDRGDPRLIEDLLLADAYFTRVAALDPRETRVPSWQVPTRLALARIFRDSPSTERDALDALRAPLIAAHAADPGFHGFALALISRDAPVDSATFQQGLAAVRSTIADADPNDPSVQNQPRWPHNREGFLLFAADYEHRAGAKTRALELLEQIEAVAEFATWPFREEVGKRRDGWSEGREMDAGAGWMQSSSCVLCHRGR